MIDTKSAPLLARGAMTDSGEKNDATDETVWIIR